MQQGEMTMDLPTSGGLAGAIGGLTVVITGCVVWVRRLLSRDEVGRAGDKASYDIITMQRQQIEDDRKRIRELDAALDDAHKRIRELNVLVTELTKQVSMLQMRLGGGHDDA